MSNQPLDLDATYSTNRKALKRWAHERLSLEPRADGSIVATFRYEGTTCSDMGRPLAFVYDVTLGPREDGYPIQEQRCAPAAGDEGYTFMCRYRAAAPQLMAAIAEESPLHGRPLNEVLAWERPASGASCYCEGESRDRKWGLVLETIHFALAEETKAMRDIPALEQT